MLGIHGMSNSDDEDPFLGNAFARMLNLLLDKLKTVIANHKIACDAFRDTVKQTMSNESKSRDKTRKLQGSDARKLRRTGTLKP